MGTVETDSERFLLSECLALLDEYFGWNVAPDLSTLAASDDINLQFTLIELLILLRSDVGSDIVELGADRVCNISTN